MSSPNITISDTPAVSSELLAQLESHLPYSLPVLRRLQFALNFPGGSTPTTHILHTYYSQDDSNNSSGNSGHFAAAYVDLNRSPETEIWLYSTLEDVSTTLDPSSPSVSLPATEAEACDELVLALLRRVRRISGVREKKPAETMVGSLNEALRRRLADRGVGMRKTANVPDGLPWEFCGKWLFRVQELPLGMHGEEIPLPVGMRWDRVARGDLGLVRSRTYIQRQEATMLLLPSTVVRLDDGTPVAWAFGGLDGTLMTLHVEEPFRRRGLARAVACKLMRDHVKDYGNDGWGLADVFVQNHRSQGVCKSIGGKLSWCSTWAILDLSTVGDAL
ncbi:hypothetical protein B0T22DRAFT_89234 [Podospora appendiculata]|uniref:GCN5-related N-acetyltransferase Rv2170-like domain-containing protein n=1 Tax=Podospora appendiculata TaxID=314037 RepID=A0AAE0XKD7_9PEZI|nr:hypothetical protein B0T22DRAFT_89234 [Podospora appendiculata]